MKILIADDQPHFRCVLRQLLEGHNDWTVCAEAKDGIEAVSLANQFQPDLVVLDFAMPEMNGLEAGRQISGAFPEMPIIMHTLFACESVEDEARKCGIQRVTSKFDGRMLIHAIEAAFADAHPTHKASGKLPPQQAA